MSTKLGLALSGGGFRAAFFHVGALARMAELRLLGKIDVISTVSGGSIVGGIYWLRLKAELDRDEPPSDETYVAIVEQVLCDLLEPVQKNLRARVFFNPFKSLEMMARTAYSRSDRIGDLLDRMFYKDAWAGARDKRLGVIETQIAMKELRVAPRTDRRVPEFVMNATCLNTGHGWRFTPYGMGEPRIAGTRDQTDRNTELGWGFFEQNDGVPPITSAQRDFPFGLAVAASGGFPGLASPLPITGLYTGYRVRLMDGGAHDNQGVEALRDHCCTAFIVSDASAQLADKPSPTGFLPMFLARINSIYGDRVREEQLDKFDWDADAVLQLQQGLGRPLREPLGDNGMPIHTRNPAQPEPVEGVDPAAQRALAAIRTDLDAFSDAEAYSLMLDGYLIAKDRLKAPRLDGYLAPGPPLSPAAPWKFLVAAESLASPTDSYKRKLEVGSKQLLKPLHLLPGTVRVLVLLIALGLALWGIYEGWGWFADVIDQARWLRIVFLVAIPISLGSLAVARVVGLLLGPRIVARRLAKTWLGFIARWAPIVALVFALAGLLVAAYAWGESVGHWLGVDWNRWTAVGAAAAVYFAPTLVPWLLAIFWWLEGKLYLRMAKLS